MPSETPERKETLSPPGRSGVTKKPSAACVHCHRRKVRCDARAVGFPCSNCRSTGKTDCRIHEKKKRPPVRSILDPVPILCRPPPPSSVAQPAGNAPGLRRTETGTTVHYEPTSTQGASAQLSTLSRLPEDAGARPINDRLAVDAEQHPRSTSISSVEGERKRELEKRLVNLIDEEELDRREIQKGVRAIYLGHDVSNMSFLIRQQRGKDDDGYHFPGADIPRRQLKTGHDQLLQDALTLPEQALADELVDAYFAEVNPGCPLVDEELFMTQYRKRDPTDPPSITVLQAILLVGAHVTREKPERERLKEVFFRRCKWLFDHRIERNRDYLVQAALLLTWHSDTVDDDVSANAHYWVGVAARIATGLGMHRDPVSSKFAASDRRTWRRIWWILVLFDVMVSLSYGRPQAVNLDDCDVTPLIPDDFEGCGPRVQVDYLIFFAELGAMISYILRERFGLRVSPERRKAILPEADEALANWSLRLPDSLRLARTSDIDPWTAMLHLTYNNFLILLHRPHPRASAYSDDYGPHDAEICSTAAGMIATIFEELRQKGLLKFLWCSGVFTLFTAMIQVRVELRFSNPLLAINGLRRFDSTIQSLREVADYWSSADTILRLFENSKRLQEDLKLAAGQSSSHTQQKSSSNTGTTMSTTPLSASSSSVSQHPLRQGQQQQQQQQQQRQQTPTQVPATQGPVMTTNAIRATPNQSLQAAPTAQSSSTPWLNGVGPSQLNPDPAVTGIDLTSNITSITPIVPPIQITVSAATTAAAPSAANLDPMDTSPPRNEYLDWRQLFPFTDTTNLTGVTLPVDAVLPADLEDEWRQLYWQEPPMADMFHDGGWMHS